MDHRKRIESDLWCIRSKDVKGYSAHAEHPDPQNQCGFCWFAIIPEQQGNGYAKEAIKYIEKEVIKQNYKVIRLTVYEKNKYAIGLYEKLGFDRVESGEYCINDKKFIGYEKII